MINIKRGTKTSVDRKIDAAAAEWAGRRDAGLSSDEESELQRWIDADPRHRTALSFYDSAWSALARPSQSGARAEFEQQLAALAGRRRRRRIAASSAALIVLFCVSLGTWNSLRRAPESSPPSAVVIVPNRQILPDGSQVELKGNAHISLDYTASTRRVVLGQGEAHFSVQKNAARPFVVSVGGVEVRAVGTAFSVQWRASVVEVLVTEGQVAVEKSAGPTLPDVRITAVPLATIGAGKRMVLDVASAAAIPEVSVVPRTELDERLAWRNLRLELTGTPLAEAVALLNQHAPASAPRLVIAEPSAGSIRISGIFRADNTEAFVFLLEGAFGVKAERSGNTIALRKAR